jgi:hypothetical protein
MHFLREHSIFEIPLLYILVIFAFENQFQNNFFNCERLSWHQISKLDKNIFVEIPTQSAK